MERLGLLRESCEDGSDLFAFGRNGQGEHKVLDREACLSNLVDVMVTEAEDASWIGAWLLMLGTI